MSFDKTLEVLRYLPRINLSNIRLNPYGVKQRREKRGTSSRRKGSPHDGAKSRNSYVPIGFESWGHVPFYLRVPKEPYYEGFHLRREYPPLSLKQLQQMIDNGRLDASKPVDLTAICNTQLYQFDPLERQFGIHLTDEGLDNFKAKVFIEVQHAKEHVIAAVERNGGVILNAYYDVNSLVTAKDPKKFFLSGKPVPKRQLPTEIDVFDFYMDAKNRGYLGDPEKIAEERLVTAQKFGYELPNIAEDPEMQELLKFVKDPRQIFYGIEPGWLINLKNKSILRPKDEKLREYYAS